MPALILMSGEVLIESAAILDYLTSSDRAVHSCQSRESRAAGA
jgi:glutathione S-transferase